MGKQIIDLEPYRDGKKKMMITCSHKGCKEQKDITKEYIQVEEQNNKRRKSLGEKFEIGSDELAIYLMGWSCKEHIWDKHWICQYCEKARFLDDFDNVVHEVICKEMQNKPKDENAYDYLRRIDWRKKF